MRETGFGVQGEKAASAAVSFLNAEPWNPSWKTALNSRIIETFRKGDFS